MSSMAGTSCCGMCQYGGLEEFSSSKAALLDMVTGFWKLNKSIIMFSCSTKSRIGLGVKKLIEEHKLGEVLETETEALGEENIRVFVWNVNRENLHVWYVEYYDGHKVGDEIMGTEAIAHYWQWGKEFGPEHPLTITAMTPNFQSFSLRNNATGKIITGVPRDYMPKRAAV